MFDYRKTDAFKRRERARLYAARRRAKTLAKKAAAKRKEDAARHEEEARVRKAAAVEVALAKIERLREQQSSFTERSVKRFGSAADIRPWPGAHEVKLSLAKSAAHFWPRMVLEEEEAILVACLAAITQ